MLTMRKNAHNLHDKAICCNCTNYQCKRAFTYLTMKCCNFRGYEDMTFESCFKNLIFDDGKLFVNTY